MLKFLFVMLISFSAMATKPCAPDKGQREWLVSMQWAAVGKLIKRNEKYQPYPNCSIEDKSQCSMQDVSELTFEILEWQKGSRNEKTLGLKAGLCAPMLKLKVGASYQIYGTDPRFYDYIKAQDK